MAGETSSTVGMHAYGEPAYWDERYRQDPGPFDWYQNYNTLSPLFDHYLHRSHRLLLVGCGNSALGENMIADGYQDVMNIDISSVVIEAMQKKYQDKPQLKYIKMDVRDMNSFEDGSFDAIIDKGTLDSLMCGQNPQHNATKMLEEVGRVLKDKGVYILVTYGDPSYRLHLLTHLHLWNLSVHVIGSSQIGGCKKGQKMERLQSLHSCWTLGPSHWGMDETETGSCLIDHHGKYRYHGWSLKWKFMSEKDVQCLSVE